MSGGECGLRWARQAGPSTEWVPVLPPVSPRQLLSEPQCPRLCIGFSSGIGGRSAPVVGSTPPVPAVTHGPAYTPALTVPAAPACAWYVLGCSGRSWAHPFGWPRLPRELLHNPQSRRLGQELVRLIFQNKQQGSERGGHLPKVTQRVKDPWPQGLGFGSGPPAFLQEAALVL